MMQIRKSLCYHRYLFMQISFVRESELELPHPFDSFYRGSNVTDKPGNGLGLYISRQIMNKMDGEIFAERKENGMSFCMVFRL